MVEEEDEMRVSSSMIWEIERENMKYVFVTQLKKMNVDIVVVVAAAVVDDVVDVVVVDDVVVAFAE